MTLTLSLLAVPVTASDLTAAGSERMNCPVDDAQPNGVDAGYSVENGLYLSWGYQNGDAAYINPLCLDLEDLLDPDLGGLPDDPVCLVLEATDLGYCDG